MIVASSLFLCPADPTWLRGGQGGGRRLLDATSITKLPWDVTVLMGGGFALAEASKESGLARWLAGVIVFRL
jgi:di/tricarboxylate transporter